MTGAYSILMTDAFILHTRGVGEADRIINALTRESGVVSIYARSIRREGAKMRSAMKPYARVYLSAVQGKRNVLKDITVTDTLADVWSDETKYTALVRLLLHINALVPPVGDRDVALFDTVETAVQQLQRSPAEHAGAVLLVAQVMSLSALGYVPDIVIRHTMFTDILDQVLSSADARREFERHLHTALLHQ